MVNEFLRRVSGENVDEYLDELHESVKALKGEGKSEARKKIAELIFRL